MFSNIFAFEHVNIIPMDEERILFNQTVIVQNNRICEIGDADTITISGETSKIDATG